MSSLMDFESLVLSLNPVLYCPFFKGNVNKEDAYGGTLSVANGSPNFTTGEHKRLLNINGGRLSIADSGARPELRVDPGTLAVFSAGFRFATPTENNYRLVSKIDAGGNHLDWYMSSAVQAISFAGSVPFWSDNPDGVRSMMVTFEDGGLPHLWYDGIDMGVGSTSANITANDADLSVGCLYTNIRPCPVSLTCVLMFPTILTAQNISDLYETYTWVNISTTEPQLTSARPLQVANPLMHLDGKVVAAEAIDRSENSYNLAKQNAVEMEPDCPVGVGFEAHGGVRGDAYMDITDTGLDDHAERTYAFWIRFDGRGEVNTGRILEKGSLKALVYANSAGTLVFQEAWSGGAAVWNSSTNLALGEWYHVVIRHDGIAGSVPTLSLNGVTSPFTVGSASSGTRDSDAGIFTLLDQRNHVREMDGVIADFVWFARYLTDAEVAELYLRAALRCLDRGYSHVYPDSLGVKAVGNVGPFSIVSGTHGWTDNVLSCSVAGGLAMRYSQAYGAYYFAANKAGGANRIRVMFIASVDAFGVSGQNGYELRITNSEALNLYRISNGSVVVTLISTAASYIANGVDYSFFKTRDSDSVFRLWIRGGAYTTWTLVGTPVSDVTHTKSYYVVVDPDVGDKISNMLYFPYGGSLTPNDVPWLAD